MTYSASTIANYFLDKASQANQTLSPMKLLKLVYFAHGWSLGIRNIPLISETIEAWPYGPVIKSLYKNFKKFGNGDITEKTPTDKKEQKSLHEDQETNALLDRIWEVYGNLNAIQLSNITHENGSPWDIAWNKENGKTFLSYPINNDLIQRYFSEKADSKV